MRVEQSKWDSAGRRSLLSAATVGRDADLVFAFGGTSLVEQPSVIASIREHYPRAHLMGCSTAGEICATSVSDDSLVVTAVRFDSTRIEGAQINVGASGDSHRAGVELARKLKPEGLVHVFVLSDGLAVNGSELVRGLTEVLPPHVTVTGGLSGDGARFKKTLAFWDQSPEPGNIVALGLYGHDLVVGYASLGGWDPFGPDRRVTRSKGNVLYELDGRSALELYKTYLGDQASGLPATGLLFPLSIRGKDQKDWVVRTILAVNEEEQSLTFAGDVPEGFTARLMKANFDRLIDGAAGAASASREKVGPNTPDLALLISCVGRKMILKQRIEEEVEAVQEVLGPDAAITGFYSYGEISPFTPGAKCELHNQTMTITTLSERKAA